jgi:hypothetical protein
MMSTMATCRSWAVSRISNRTLRAEVEAVTACKIKRSKKKRIMIRS